MSKCTYARGALIGGHMGRPDVTILTIILEYSFNNILWDIEY